MRRNLPGILWTALIVLLMGIPGNRFPQISSFWEWLEPDKLIHLVLFGVWAYLILRQNPAQYHRNRGRLFVLVLLSGAILSAATELLQHYVFINRSGNIYDALANIIGTIFGMIIYITTHTKKSDKR
ncbi:MAG: VanZ family protein [Bacteroidetes bacterium]|nr:VanZ family protein [Bacteroidota bacterium]